MHKQFNFLTRYSLLVIFYVLFAGNGVAAEGSSGKEKGKFYGAKPTEYPAWFKDSFLDFKEDIAEAAAAGKRLMVVFHQNGCPYCNALVERNLAQKDIEQAVRKNFDVVALNMWGSREVASIGGKSYTEKTFAAALKVQFTPTILFFNEQGKIILRLNGYIPPKRFKVALDYVINKQESKVSYRDYMAAHLPKGSSGKLHKEDFFSPAPYDLTRTSKNNKPIAVFFEQTDCPNCDTLHNKVLVDKSIHQTVKDFEVIQLDMWSDTPVTTPKGKKTTAKQWARQLDVKYAPTIVVFDGSGKEIIRSEAFFKIFHTNGILTYVSSGAYKKQPSFQRYLNGVAHDLQAEGKDVDIWHMEGEKR
ncbi:MAG: thioredoxin fold domain-containing protein [Thioalkalispiraceae bacterium]|jgi:thioredoxin-related protein